MKEARDRECNSRSKAVGDINEYMDDLGKELEGGRYEAVTDRAALASTEAKAHRFSSGIDGVMERSKGGENN